MKFYARKWLNIKGYHSTAFILAKFIPGSDDKYKYVDTNLCIGDCSRQIELSIDVETKEDRHNTIQKLDTLIKVLTQLRNIIILYGKERANAS